MSKLTKEEVISALESALTAKQGTAVTIEQKGSWYKIDGGKSLRFSELEAMLAEFGGAEVAAKPAAKEVKPAAKAPAKKAAAKKETHAKGGKTPKQLWREKLAGKGQLPRGF